MSLYDGGLYNPYGSRTVSLTRGGGEKGEVYVGRVYLQRKSHLI